MSVLQSAIAAASGSAGPTAYQIERSLRFNSADSAYLAWTPPQAGNRRTWTWSGWVKVAKIPSATGGSEYMNLFSAGSGTAFTGIRLYDGSSPGKLQVFQYNGTAFDYNLEPTQIFRDVSSWYHLVVAVDTSQATAANRVKIYVNGVQITAFGTSTYPSQNLDGYVNSSSYNHTLGRSAYSTADQYFNGYLAEVNFIDGQALTPSDFGETATATGVWIPKAYAGTYGNNGFYLPFNDNSTVLNLGRNRQTLTADPYFNYTTLLLHGPATATQRRVRSRRLVRRGGGCI